MSALPPSRDYMLPPKSDFCRACGQPADGKPVWMVDIPHWEHEHCRDWSKANFPYEWKLTAMRSVARALQQAYGNTIKVGLLLRSLRGRWPRGAREGLEQLKQHEADLDESLRKLRERLERR